MAKMGLSEGDVAWTEMGTDGHHVTSLLLSVCDKTVFPLIVTPECLNQFLWACFCEKYPNGKFKSIFCRKNRGNTRMNRAVLRTLPTESKQHHVHEALPPYNSGTMYPCFCRRASLYWKFTFSNKWYKSSCLVLIIQVKIKLWYLNEGNENKFMT